MIIEKNMTKYKHKKTGKIAAPFSERTSYYIEGSNLCNSYPNWMIENSNDWEEIVEEPKLDYEILSFKRNESSKKYAGTTFTLSSNGTYNPSFKESNLTLEHCLKGGFNIHSVKRLSDGEIFTVGDKWLENFDMLVYIIEKIRFGVCNNGIYFDGSHSSEIKKSQYHGKPLLDAMKYVEKKPLFTTEDGVDIFEGEPYYLVYIPQCNLNSENPCISFNKQFFDKDKHKLFSTKEEAEVYIIMNKQCLSLNDIFYMWKEKGWSGNGIFASYSQFHLFDLVKQKLKIK